MSSRLKQRKLMMWKPGWSWKNWKQMKPRSRPWRSVWLVPTKKRIVISLKAWKQFRYSKGCGKDLTNNKKTRNSIVPWFIHRRKSWTSVTADRVCWTNWRVFKLSWRPRGQNPQNWNTNLRWEWRKSTDQTTPTWHCIHFSVLIINNTIHLNNITIGWHESQTMIIHWNGFSSATLFIVFLLLSRFTPRFQTQRWTTGLSMKSRWGTAVSQSVDGTSLAREPLCICREDRPSSPLRKRKVHALSLFI